MVMVMTIAILFLIIGLEEAAFQFPTQLTPHKMVAIIRLCRPTRNRQVFADGCRDDLFETM